MKSSMGPSSMSGEMGGASVIRGGPKNKKKVEITQHLYYTSIEGQEAVIF